MGVVRSKGDSRNQEETLGSFLSGRRGALNGWSGNSWNTFETKVVRRSPKCTVTRGTFDTNNLKDGKKG